MKISVVLFVAMMGFTSAISAQNTVPSDARAQVAVAVDDNRKPIKPEDLPQAVKTTLQGQEYRDWSVSAAFHVKKDNAEYYEVELTRAMETKTVKLDKEGKKVETLKQQ